MEFFGYYEKDDVTNRVCNKWSGKSKIATE